MKTTLTEQVEETQLALGVAGHLDKSLRREETANQLEMASRRLRVLFQRNHLERSVQREEEGDRLHDTREVFVDRRSALRWSRPFSPT